jgi:hypothetical protein
MHPSLYYDDAAWENEEIVEAWIWHPLDPKISEPVGDASLNTTKRMF